MPPTGESYLEMLGGRADGIEREHHASFTLWYADGLFQAEAHQQEAVARGLDYPAAVPIYRGIDDIPAQSLQRRQRPALVQAHQLRVAGYISRNDSRRFALFATQDVLRHHLVGRW
jgi:hypothetical protein